MTQLGLEEKSMKSFEEAQTQHQNINCILESLGK